MKKTLVFILALFLVFSAACVPNKEDKNNEMTEISLDGMPDYSAYEADLHFTIGQWVNIPNKYSWLNYDTGKIENGSVLTDAEFEEQYRYIKEAGINLASNQLGEGSTAACVKLLKNAEKQGIGQIVFDAALRNVLLDASISDAEAVDRGMELVESYKDSPALVGHNMEDEPTLGEFDGLERAYRRYKYIFPDKLFYTNLFPVIAPPSMVGEEYTDYVKASAKKLPVKMISYDHYPLYGYEGKTSVIDNFLLNMELVIDGKNPEQEMWTFLQSGNSAGTRAPETYADIAWQAYSFMAFGGKGIWWFCYSEVPSERFSGMINGKGERTEAYYLVQKVNKEILSFDHVYLNFDWKGVLTYNGKNTEKLNENFANLQSSLIDSHERIANVEAEEDLLVGAFKDGDGRDGFMAVNFSDPGKNKSNKVKIVFNNCSKVLVIRHGVQKAYLLKNGIFETTFESGEGCFIIPVK